MSPDILIVPRKPAFFQPSEGRFVPINSNVPEALRTPMVRAESGPYTGYESGFRSGLLFADEQWYKAKGCRPSNEDFHGVPHGTQTFSFARRGADKILERRQLFMEMGLSYPAEPVGFWVYDHIKYKRESTAATLYGVDGDTRLDELLWWVEKAPLSYVPSQERKQIRKLLGFIFTTSGRLLSILHKNHFTWDQDEEDTSNAHAGNVVIHPDASGSVRVGLIDFDNSLSFHPGNGSPKKMEEVQTRDRRTIKASLGQHSAISGSVTQTWNPYEIPRKIAEQTIRKALPDLPDDDAEAVQGYLLNRLHQPDSGLSRMELIEEYERGYEGDVDGDNPMPWSEMNQIRGAVGKLGRDFQQRVSTLIGEEDKGAIVISARRYSFFAYYRFPVVVNRETVAISPPETAKADAIETKETLDQVYSLLSQHEAILRDLPADGKNFFTFPQLSKPMAEQYAFLKPEDLKNIAHEWIHGDLKSALAYQFSARTIGAFLLSLSQTHSFTMTDMIKGELPTDEDSISVDTLVRANELLELIPGAALQEKDMRNYLLKLKILKREGFNLEKEVQRKSALSLFPHGLITHDLHEIFNHRQNSIILNDFTANHIPALEAAQQYPRLVDEYMGEDLTQQLLLIALSGAQARLGQQDVTLLNVSNGQLQALSVFLQYFFASQGQEAIHNPKLAEALAIPIKKEWLVMLSKQLMEEGRPVHPDSTFIKQLKETNITTTDIVSLMKAALDATQGDLSRIDPLLLSAFERNTYPGKVKAVKASELILACIGFGVDIPDLVTRCITQGKNNLEFVNVLATDRVDRGQEKYGQLPYYPIHPIHTLMSKGIDVLPATIKELFNRNQNKQAVVNKWAEGILKHLFQQGYYHHYFGAWITPDGYPPPAVTPRDIWKTPKHWEIWRLVHQDIWDLVSKADPVILRNYIKNQIPDGKVNLQFARKSSNMTGTRTCTVAESLPPNLYQLVSKS